MIENVERVDRQRQATSLLPSRLGEPDVVRPANIARGEAGSTQRVAAYASRTGVGHPGMKEIDAGDFAVRQSRGEAGGRAEVAPAAHGESAEQIEPVTDIEVGRSPFRADRCVRIGRIPVDAAGAVRGTAERVLQLATHSLS